MPQARMNRELMDSRPQMVIGDVVSVLIVQDALVDLHVLLLHVPECIKQI